MAVGPWPERGALPSGRRNCRPGTGLSDPVETLKGPLVRLLLAETTIRTPSRRPALLLSARIGARSRFCGTGEAEHGAERAWRLTLRGASARRAPRTGLGAEYDRSRCGSELISAKGRVGRPKGGLKEWGRTGTGEA